MNTMKWLLRRELWENKGMFLWTPVVLGAVMIVLFSVASMQFGGGHFTVTDGATTDDAAQMSQLLAGLYMANAAPILLTLGFIVFFYCLGALNEERKDRSILFWKSLPISDQETVLSKVAAGLLMAPLIAIAIGVVTSLALALVIGIKLAMHGTPVFGAVLSQPEFYLAPFELVGLLPVYMLWALPTVGWLLMVSSWARSRVFLWAVGVPLLVIALMKWLGFITGTGDDANWVIRNVIARGLAGLIPGNWLFFEHLDPQRLVAHVDEAQHLSLSTLFFGSWRTLMGYSVWIGAVAGAAMIYAAMVLRRTRDDG